MIFKRNILVDIKIEQNLKFREWNGMRFKRCLLWYFEHILGCDCSVEFGNKSLEVGLCVETGIELLKAENKNAWNLN